MQIKVFESVDMASGLKMVKEAFGPEALILSTKTIKDGRMGLLGKPMLEITAAREGTAPVKNYSSGIDTKISPAFTLNPSPRFNHIVDEPVAHLLRKDNSDQGRSHAGSSFSVAGHPAESMRTEVNELKDLVRELAGQVSNLNKNTCSTLNSPDSGHPADDPLSAMLEDRGINRETSDTLSAFLRETLTDPEISDPAIVSARAVDAIKDLIETANPLPSSGNGQQRIALVGPTGVGKTTTLAKIAASCAASLPGSIALITVDTYRIAAVEQLKVYGEIMHLPVDVVITPDQLRQAIESHRDKDLILIDTAGRSPKDDFCIDELSSFLSPDLNIDSHLVLSAVTREKELLNIISRFQRLGLQHTIFTKVDECMNLGILLNIQIQNLFPVSYITNGQRVPEDLIIPSPKVVAELIMTEHQGYLYD